MIGAVVISHGTVAQGLVGAMEVITEEAVNVETVSVACGDSTDDIRERLASAIEKSDTGGGVIVFTDMFGGTPTNVALSFLNEGAIEILTGVNLPILLKFIARREGESAKELVAYLKEYGAESIVPASEMLNLEE